MKLNTEQQDKLVTKLNKVWNNKVCEICSEPNWIIDDTFFEFASSPKHELAIIR